MLTLEVIHCHFERITIRDMLVKHTVGGRPLPNPLQRTILSHPLLSQDRQSFLPPYPLQRTSSKLVLPDTMLHIE